MSMTNRLTGFFLAALGVVLIGFSTALYSAIHVYLFRQLDQQIRSAQAILSAAAEIHPEGVEWEPDERELPLGQDTTPDRLRWMIQDGNGQRIDRSRNWNDADLMQEWQGEHIPSRLRDRQGRPWRTDQRKLLPAGSMAANSEPNAKLFSSLLITVCVPVDPVERMLARLGVLLFGVSTAVWIFAVFLGRLICRKALAPLAKMVESARGLDATDAGWSLELAGTGDELDEMGVAFNDLLARLRVAYERQRRFSSEASHQLRTPLTALIGQVEVALRRDRSEEEYRRVLMLVGGQASNLTQIVEALLFLGRAESEAALPEINLMDLRTWVTSYLKDRPGHSRAGDIAFDSPADSPLCVRAHPHLLAQLLENLLDNACKYSPSGTPILVRAQECDGNALLMVEDAGPGISSQDLPHVFEPFFRSDQARRMGQSGFGLGLAVARRIAQAFGGTIIAVSRLGAGSRFVLQLPLVTGIAVQNVYISEELTA